MEKDYTIFDLIDDWQDDIDSFLSESNSCQIEPNVKVLDNIRSYAKSFTCCAMILGKSFHSLNNDIELCLN